MPELTSGQIALILAILTHAFATIWWASKMSTTVTFMKDELIKIGNELIKRDDQISALWKKVDSINEKVLGLSRGD